MVAKDTKPVRPSTSPVRRFIFLSSPPSTSLHFLLWIIVHQCQLLAPRCRWLITAPAVHHRRLPLTTSDDTHHWSHQPEITGISMCSLLLELFLLCSLVSHERNIQSYCNSLFIQCLLSLNNITNSTIKTSQIESKTKPTEYKKPLSEMIKEGINAAPLL